MAIFEKGKSGNPGGRPKVTAHVKELARNYTEQAVNALVEVVEDTKAPPSARVAAASAILDRGYGKPTQTIEANVSFLDRLEPAELEALDAALSAIEGVAAPGDTQED